MFYAIRDLQTGGYLHTGRNSKSMSEIEEALRGYIQSDLDEAEGDGSEMSLEYILSAWEFEIEKSMYRFERGE